MQQSHIRRLPQLSFNRHRRFTSSLIPQPITTRRIPTIRIIHTRGRGTLIRRSRSDSTTVGIGTMTTIVGKDTKTNTATMETRVETTTGKTTMETAIGTEAEITIRISVLEARARIFVEAAIKTPPTPLR
jgi:hypothetical protein